MPDEPHVPATSRLAGSESVEAGDVQICDSTALRDRAWDDFLRATPLGQYQQSSLWTQYKAAEGWQCHRTVASDASGIVGGFQILWTVKRGVRVGYVSKGPVPARQEASLVHLLAGQMCRAAATLGLSAVIVQMPDDQVTDFGVAGRLGLLETNPARVIEATCLVDVSPDPAVIRGRLHRKTRYGVRKAEQAGVLVRAGSERDLPHFFDLMSETCRRQGVMPAPGSVASLRALWAAFAPTGDVHLWIATRDGREPAALLNLAFGSQVTLWKKGWDGTHRTCHVNELLEAHAFEWAHANGYRACDFCSIDPGTAREILSGRSPSSEHLNSRDGFHLRFGAVPKLLPPALLYVPHPVLRWGYRRVAEPLAKLAGYGPFASTGV